MKWRATSPNIVQFWYELGIPAAMAAVATASRDGYHETPWAPRIGLERRRKAVW